MDDFIQDELEQARILFARPATFIMAGFPAGLLVYWAWNNILSIAQQYFIMHRFKAENPIDDLIAKLTKKPA